MQELKEILIEEMQGKGKITLREFMEIALYHDKYGYYNQKQRVTGKKGDYYTAVDVHPIFGFTIAKFVYSVWQDLDRPSNYTILEIGHGRANMAYDILSYLEYFHRECFLAVEYILLERSVRMQEKAKQRLREYHKKTRWLSDLRELKSFDGAVITNELFDSLPIHKMIWRGGKWKEVYITLEKSDKFKEVEDIPSTSSLTELLECIEEPLREAQVYELNISAVRLIEDISSKLNKGKFLIIDYGYERDQLLSRFPYGSLVSYKGHRAYYSYLESVGEQDITTHIDFTLIRDSLVNSGFEIIYYEEQGRFLLDFGIMGILRSLEEQEENTKNVLMARMALKNLTLNFPNYRVMIALKDTHK